MAKNRVKQFLIILVLCACVVALRAAYVPLLSRVPAATTHREVPNALCTAAGSVCRQVYIHLSNQSYSRPLVHMVLAVDSLQVARDWLFVGNGEVTTTVSMAMASGEHRLYVERIGLFGRETEARAFAVDTTDLEILVDYFCSVGRARASGFDVLVSRGGVLRR
jgi:hypothetical protein